MFRAMKLAAAGVCAAALLLMPTSAHAADDFTTWLFAEGSTSGLLGFEKELLLANPNTIEVVVTIAAFTQDGEAITPFTIPIAPLSRTGINVRAIPGVGDRAGIALRVSAGAPIIAERTMYWGGGLFRGGKLWPNPVSDMRGGHNEKGVGTGAYTWYFAEGEGKFFNTFFSVANPNPVDTKVRARYLDDRGVEVVQEEIVPANARRTFWPTAILSARFVPGQAGFATIIESVDDVTVGARQPVVAERQMYWGPGSPFGIRGGHASMGITTPSPTWLFAEGVQGGSLNFDTYVLLFNQNPTTATVTVKFFGDSGNLLAEVVRTIPALARDNVPTSTVPALANQAFAIQVEANQPIIAERAVYWRGLLEGHATAGVNAAARKWGFAEGMQGGFLMYQDNSAADKRRFNTFFPLYNPGATDAVVTVYFYTEGANTGVTKQLTVPARSRATVWPLLYPELANQKFATFFSSTEPLVAERVVYWGVNFAAGHASSGTPLPDTFPLVAPPAAPSAPGTTLTVTPNRGVPGGGTVVEIEGSGFGHNEIGTAVRFGATPAAFFEVENDGLIRAITPPGATGKVDVTVETKGAVVTAPQAFEYFNPWAATLAPLNTFNRSAGFACMGGGRPCSIVQSFEGTVRDLARRQPFDIANSCRAFGGNEKFVEDLVAELRLATGSNRWGLNIKRGNEGLSEDIVDYYYGPEGNDMRNSTEVFIIDVIANHCNPANRSGGLPAWIDQTSATAAARTIGRWTLGPMCSNPRYRNARRPNGEWLFPECR
jgi:hypothetical protein